MSEFVQQQSIANKQRLETRGAETRARNLGELTRIAADPVRARQFLLRSSMIESQRRAEALTLKRSSKQAFSSGKMPGFSISSS